MKYSIHTVKDDDNNFFYCLFEEATQQVFAFYYFPDDAEAWLNFLSKGGAFNGHTPSFILKEINKRRDLNLEFSKLSA